MYNGIGMASAKGSGSNGHVQRNWAFVRKTKNNVNYKLEAITEAQQEKNAKLRQAFGISEYFVELGPTSTCERSTGEGCR
jgi:hypothetical protein